MKFSNTFDLDDQYWFAQVSGDYNPIHIDEIESRKLHSGGILVHGIHTVIWALDCFFRNSATKNICALKTQFFKPIYLGQKLSIVLENIDTKRDVIKVYDKELLVSIIVETSDIAFGDKIVDGVYSFEFPKEFKYNDLTNVLPISLSEKKILSRFPHICKSVGLEVVSNIIGLSRLVGMECPGIDSLFAGFNIKFTHVNEVDPNRIYWSISKYHGNHAPINISVKSSVMEGFISAFIRPKPVTQLAFGQISNFTKNRIDLSNTYSIIIGGSRGLGEVTSKIIASYGGNVIVTYYNGQNEAIEICEDINSNSQEKLAVPLYLNVENPRNLLDYISDNAIQVDVIYYFATPKIKGVSSIELEKDMLNIFNSYYTVYFSSILKLLEDNLTNKIKIFYPSTVFLNTGNMNLMEYVLAKKSAEIFIEHVSCRLKNIEIIVHRLEMLNTDQNNSVFPVETEDPLIIMNDIVLRMYKIKTNERY